MCRSRMSQMNRNRGDTKRRRTGQLWKTTRLVRLVSLKGCDDWRKEEGAGEAEEGGCIYRCRISTLLPLPLPSTWTWPQALRSRSSICMLRLSLQRKNSTTAGNPRRDHAPLGPRQDAFEPSWVDSSPENLWRSSVPSIPRRQGRNDALTTRRPLGSVTKPRA